MSINDSNIPPSKKLKTQEKPSGVSSVRRKVKETTYSIVDQTKSGLIGEKQEKKNDTHKVMVRISPETREAVARSAANAGLSPEVFTEQAVRLFFEQMTTSPDTPVGRFIHEMGMEQMHKYILQQVKQSQPYTSGTEGDIYRLEITGKEYIIVKKRYFVLQNEHLFQKKAYEIAKELSKEETNTIAVPEVFSHFIDGSDEYIVMEYIHGKTLYALILEQLVTKIILPLLEKAGKNTLDPILNERLQELLTDYGVYTKQFALDFDTVSSSSFYTRFEQSSRIHFPNDTEAELGTLQFYNLLYDAGLLKENPNQKDRKTGANPFLIQEYSKYFSKLALFEESESKEIRKQLRTFIQKFHENKLYHRDLGGNPRNIMFGEDGKVYIIDFGKGIEASGVSSSGEEVYHDALHNGRYDDDFSIVTLIKNLTESSEYSEAEKNSLIISELKKNLPMEEIHEAAKELGIQEKFIAPACHLSSGMSLKAITSWLDRMLAKNDRIAPHEFIYYPKILLGKAGSARMKDEYINATQRGGAKLLVSLFMLNEDEILQLQKTINIQKQEGNLNDKKLEYIDLFSRFITEVANVKK